MVFGCVNVSGWLCGWIGLGWVGFHTKRIYESMITLNRQRFRFAAALVQERRNQKMTRKLNQHLASL